MANASATCNATGATPFIDVAAPTFAVSPLGAVAAAPPPGMAAPAPAGVTGTPEAGAAVNVSSAAAAQDSANSNVTVAEPGSGIGGLHALSAGALGVVALALALVL